VLQCAALLLLASSARAQPYVEITAELELLAYRPQMTNTPGNSGSRSVSLVCVTGGKEWRIDHDYIKNGQEAWYFDGTNLLNTSRITQPMSEKARELVAKTSGLAVVSFEQAKSNLSIRVWDSQGGLPLGDPAVNVAWLAFCSGSYLKRDSRLIPLPLDTLRHTRDRFAYTDKTETFPDGLGLPRTVDLFLSKKLFIASEQDFDREAFFGDRYTKFTLRTAETLEEGAPMFHYEVTESTNAFGGTWPLQFKFSQNGRKFEQNGDWFWRGSGRVKTIRPAEKPATIFNTSLNQTIVDWRFHNQETRVDAITYTSTNAFLAPINDPALQREYAKRVKWARLNSR
jgi:hypothetical protein